MNSRRTGDPYFDWLCIKIGVDPRNPRRNYGKMVTMLHGINYIPLLDMDRNRAADGLQLRVDFMNIHGPYGSSTNRGPCTLLEFLISVAARMNFFMGEEDNPHHTEWYFWKMIGNLDLRQYTDDFWESRNGEMHVEDAADRIMNNNYASDGSGGLFPLMGHYGDVRQMEIWQQMQFWLNENSDIELDI